MSLKEIGGDLLRAAGDGDLPALRAALSAGADPWITDKSGNTPLHLAAFYGHAGLIRPLVEAGVDVNARGWRERTPLCKAAWLGGTDACRELLRLGADPRIPDKDGCTPADLARGFGYKELVAMLDAAVRRLDLAEVMEAEVAPCP